MKETAHKLPNPLVPKISKVLKRVSVLKTKARDYYFEVIFLKYRCPICCGRLHMFGQSECSCSACGNVFDPTLAFQKSGCCGARMVRQTFHYSCSCCRKIVPSQFLFGEKLFDKYYFREMMQESRRRAKRKREEIRRVLAESRSAVLPFIDDPNLDSMPGLVQDLDKFIMNDHIKLEDFDFDDTDTFNMDIYHDHILNALGWNATFFSDIAPLAEDCRRDKIWRFVTLVFMQNDQEVNLTQHGNELRIQKIYNEAYN